MDALAKSTRDAQLIRSTGFFLRLAGKTQVYTPRGSPHVRMRMSHTMDVLAFAQRIVVALEPTVLDVLDDELRNGDMGVRGPGCRDERGRHAQLALATATALGHDLGHTPFGHAGETALQEVLAERGHGDAAFPRFHHNWQSVRVLERVEHHNCGYDWNTSRDGMDVAPQVLDGIVNHTRRPDAPSLVPPLYLRDGRPRHLIESSGVAQTAAGLVVAIADEVAQRVSDINDGLREKALSAPQLSQDAPACTADVLRKFATERSDESGVESRHRKSVFRVELQAALMDDYAKSLLTHWDAGGIDSVLRDAQAARQTPAKDAHKQGMASLLGGIAEYDQGLQVLIEARLYEHPKVIDTNRIADRVMRDLAEACLSEPRLALDWYAERFREDKEKGRPEAWHHVLDYLAALTDDHALERHQQLFGSAFP